MTRDGAKVPMDPNELSDLTELLGALSNESRLKIVFILSRDAPLSYVEIQERASIADNGRLNYHLRRLDGELLVRTSQGYTLTERGCRIVRVLTSEIS